MADSAEKPKSSKKESGKKESGKKEAPKGDKPAKDSKPKEDKPKKAEGKDDKPKGDKPKGDKPKAEGKPKGDKPKAEAKPKAAEKPKAAPKAAAPEKKKEPKAAPKPKPAAVPKAAAPKKESKKSKKPKVEKKALPAVKATFEKGSAVTTPESVLKKRQRDDALKTAADSHRLKSMKALRARRKVIYKRAENYAHEYQAAAKDEVRKKRQAKNVGNFYVAPEAKVVVAIRMKGIMRTHPKTTKILQLLRLRQLNNAVFIKVNKATMTMLRLVEPYVTYGAPNLKTVTDLIYKRGFAKVDKQRLPLNDNSVIAASLSKYGVICIEDVIHEIVTCGPHFKEVNNFLWPFKLNNPLGGWSDKGTHYTQGGDSGNREEDINTLIRRMN